MRCACCYTTCRDLTQRVTKGGLAAMSGYAQRLLGLLDSADARHQAQVDAQVCNRHPRTTIGEHACPLCAIDAAMRRAARAHPSAKQAAMA